MYTVVRFINESKSSEKLKRAELATRSMSTIVFDGYDRVPDRFSCDVAEDGNWWDHRDAILRFLNEYSERNVRERTSGIAVQIDVAVEESDRDDHICTRFLMDLQLMEKLVSAQIDLVFSVS